MKTIRSRLLAVLLPPMLGLALILATLFYTHQESEMGAILIFGLISLLWLIGSVWFISYNISEPIQKLKDAALHLASGDYEEPITPQGPQEIKELANTLNTMRECLLENISRLTDYPLAREKLYGEYECAELLQYEMFDKVLEDSPSDLWTIRKASLRSAPQYGLSINWEGSTLTLKEAEEEGFQGIYKLLTEGTDKFTTINLETGKSQFQRMPEPFLWSEKDHRLHPIKKPKEGDIIIVFNNGLTKQMPHPHILRDWLTKILKHFAKDGIDLTTAMLESELSFFAKKYVHHEDITIVLLTLKNIQTDS